MKMLFIDSLTEDTLFLYQNLKITDKTIAMLLLRLGQDARQRSSTSSVHSPQFKLLK